MKIEIIECDCCKKNLEPEKYLELRVSCRGHGKAGKIPDNIFFEDICHECVEAIYSAVHKVHLIMRNKE